MSNIIKQLETEQLKQNVPSFRPGDTLEVKVWVVEGSKKRLQAFEGVVIAIRNRGLHSAFTLRKISNGGALCGMQSYARITEAQHRDTDAMRTVSRYRQRTANAG